MYDKCLASHFIFKRTLTMDKKERRKKVSILLNSFLFLLSGIDMISSSRLYFGLFVMLVAVLNFLTFFETFAKNLQLYIHLSNIIVAALIAFNYYTGGSEYIHLLWIFISLLYTTVLFVFLRKRKTKLS